MIVGEERQLLQTCDEWDRGGRRGSKLQRSGSGSALLSPGSTGLGLVLMHNNYNDLGNDSWNSTTNI